MSVARRLSRSVAAQFTADARLRRGVWLCLAILLFYGVLVQSERLGEARGDHAAAAGLLDRAEASLRRRDWPELLSAERETHRDIRSEFWQAETEGVAQAELQAALAGLFADFGLRDLRIRSGASRRVPGLSDVLRVQTRLDALYRPGTEHRMVHALAAHPGRLIVDRLDLVRRSPGDSYLALVVSSYFVGIETDEAGTK